MMVIWKLYLQSQVEMIQLIQVQIIQMLIIILV